MEMVKMKKIKGTIKVETGLHIGAGSDTIEIGGMDNPIVRDPFTGEPYIPGSSLKGKIRSLVEWKENRVSKGNNNGGPCNCGECDVCRVFGVAAGGGKDEENAKNRGPTRLIVRDAVLSDVWKVRFRNGEPIVESKFENTIDRISGKAKHPRPLERVVPGVEFEFELSYRVLDVGSGPEQDEDNFKKIVQEGLALLEQDYLGGMGSRGSGRIRFVNLVDEEGNSIDLGGAPK